MFSAITPPPVHGGYGTLFALILFIAASMWIGVLANHAMRKGSFLKGFFLGNRGLGSWALALTATVQSGGTFMGFPSMVYTHGWSVGVWISGYMVVPITGFAILGKRIAQLSRHTGAITVPDLFRARFNSPALGLVASLFIMFYMSFMMVAQFKAGAIVMKLSLPGTGSLALAEEGAIDTAYFIGLAVFTLTVVGYTLIGGFLAAVWTDLFQSVMMFFGVVILLILALQQAGGLEQATRQAIEHTGPGYVYGPGYDDPVVKGYDPGSPRTFLPVSLAFSFFFVWVFAGVGSPAGIVRIMACKSTGTIRRSIYLLSTYNLFIYIPLIIICMCGRAVFPELPGRSDEIIPRMALGTTAHLPFGGFIAGLILAAPFGAVMATVSSYLVVIASGLVRDVYQRCINPHATDDQLRRLSHLVMVIVGAIAVVANIKPVSFLQTIVVFSGTGAAATFFVPALMLAYSRRATVAGVLSSMFAGASVIVVLYLMGSFGVGTETRVGQFAGLRPYYLLGLDPFIWAVSASLLGGIIGTAVSAPTDPELVSKLFDAQPPAELPGGDLSGGDLQNSGLAQA